MRCVLVVACSLVWALPAAASAHVRNFGPEMIGEAETHGPDLARVVDAGPEVPAPAGGATGKPLTQPARAKVTGHGVRFRLACSSPQSSRS